MLFQHLCLEWSSKLPGGGASLFIRTNSFIPCMLLSSNVLVHDSLVQFSLQPQVIASKNILDRQFSSYCNSSITSRKGVGSVEWFLWQNVTRDGWMGCFSSAMSYFLNNSLFYIFCFIIARLAPFIWHLASPLKIIWQSYFDAILSPKTHNMHTIMKAEKYPIETHNVTSPIGGGGSKVHYMHLGPKISGV